MPVIVAENCLASQPIVSTTFGMASQHQEKPVCLPVDRSFDLPMQNDELLP